MAYEAVGHSLGDTKHTSRQTERAWTSSEQCSSHTQGTKTTVVCGTALQASAVHSKLSTTSPSSQPLPFNSVP